MKDITLKELSKLEHVYLELINFDLMIRGNEYARAYFIMNSYYCQKNKIKGEGIAPLSVEKI